MQVWDCDWWFRKSPLYFVLAGTCQLDANDRSRSTPQENRARRAAVPLFSNRTATSTVLVARVFTTILSRAGCFTITMSTRILAMLMDRSSSVGIRLLGRMGGLPCKLSLGRSEILIGQSRH